MTRCEFLASHGVRNLILTIIVHILAGESDTLIFVKATHALYLQEKGTTSSYHKAAAMMDLEFPLQIEKCNFHFSEHFRPNLVKVVFFCHTQ